MIWDDYWSHDSAAKLHFFLDSKLGFIFKVCFVSLTVIFEFHLKVPIGIGYPCMVLLYIYTNVWFLSGKLSKV